jgi:hypothetical protein
MNAIVDMIEGASAAPAAAPQFQLSAVEHAIRAGATPDQLERLLELQVRADNHKLEMMREKRRMDEEDRKAAGVLAFRHDFAAFRGENVIIPKSKFVDRGKAGSFHQAEYGAVMQMLSPALSKHGFSLRHNEVFGSKLWTTDGVQNDIPWVYVTCFLEHRDGHSESLSLEGPPGELSANTPVQNMQATGSYLKRQSALAITGTATADEDDENRLGGKAKHREQGVISNAGDPIENEALIHAGRDASMGGMKTLTAWWSALTEQQRARLTTEFGEMRKAARLADDK